MVYLNSGCEFSCGEHCQRRSFRNILYQPMTLFREAVSQMNGRERNMVAYDENHTVKLQKALILGDAISDLPEVANSERRDEMQYGKAPRTEFQQYIRMPKEVMNGGILPSGSASKRASPKAILYDHRPLQLNEDDYQRVCRIP